MTPDPIEQIVAGALAAAGIDFLREGDDRTRPPLDFYVPDFDTYIEVKQFHSPRIAAQMGTADNVIAIQGRTAALAFAKMIYRTPLAADAQESNLKPRAYSPIIKGT